MDWSKLSAECNQRERNDSALGAKITKPFWTWQKHTLAPITASLPVFAALSHLQFFHLAT